MGSDLPLFPVQASSVAASVDHLVYFLLAVAVFFSVGIFLTIFYFAVRYRRRSESELPLPAHGAMSLEILWSVIPFGLTMIMFGWGASVFFEISRPRTTRRKSTLSANNGCGRYSTWRGSAKLTSCMSRWVRP